MTTLFILYLIAVNLLAFALFGADKKRAVRHKWRIPEATLILVSFLGGCVGALFGMRFFHHKTRKWKFRILIPASLVLWALAGMLFLYTGQYYHAGETAERYIRNASDPAVSMSESDLPVTMNNASVTVTEESGNYLFDGPGTDTAVIFYPGAKVQTEAYAPVLFLIAQEGYDCFLVNMPFRLAVFGMNKAGDILQDHPEYRHWYMSGHSLGGAMAGNYAAEHLDQFDGVIFLAAYPTKSLKRDGFRVLSLYGSEDSVLNRERYENSLSLMPDDFTGIVVEGGNHAQFGDYGEQKGDGKASIESAEQWKETAVAVQDFVAGES